MSYLFSKGNRLFGDIEFEDDTDTQIDFEDNYIGLVVGGSTVLAVSGSSVGIGTTAPDTLLHLHGTSPAISLQRDNNSTGTSTINFEGVAGVVACKMGQVAGTDNELAFSTHNGSNLLERMRIDKDGLIGIGTTTPDYTLDVAGNIGIDEKIVHNGDADTYISFSGQNQIKLVANGHSFLKYDGAIKINNANRDRDTQIMADNGNVVLHVDAGENRVGVGTTDPTTVLDINSDSIRIRNTKTPSSAGDFGVAGEICWDTNYLYICVAIDTWKRIPLDSW